MNQMIAILAILLVFAIVKCLQKHIALLTLTAYLVKRGVPQPTENEVRECTQYVIKNLIKDLFQGKGE